MTRTGEREISAVSGRLPDNPGELAYMRECVQLCQMIKNDFSTLFNALALRFPFFSFFFFCA